MNQDDQNPASQDDNADTATAAATNHLELELAKMTETARRALADLQNLKKRQEEERLTLYPLAQADLLKNFLPVIDGLHLALANMPNNLESDSWAQGIKQIAKLFDDIIAKAGLSEINPVNTLFDPQEHEAMLEVEGNKGQIIQVFEKGYKLKDKVLRPAKVSVGNG